MKNEAIRLLAQFPFIHLSMYKPDFTDGIVVRKWSMCDEHYHDWKHQREFHFEYYGKDDYFRDNYKKKIMHCTACMEDLEAKQDYYVLIFLEVKNKTGERLFSFHTPYPIAVDKNLFQANYTELPRVHHKEQEGMFRFGRALDDEEKIVFTEKRTLKSFQEALTKYKLYMQHWERQSAIES